MDASFGCAWDGLEEDSRRVRRKSGRLSSRLTAPAGRVPGCASDFRRWFDLVRELDERLSLSAFIERHLTDARRGKNVHLPLSHLLRQSIYSRPDNYENVNDVARLSQDPTFLQ
jgi:hypothetical protein